MERVLDKENFQEFGCKIGELILTFSLDKHKALSFKTILRFDRKVVQSSR